MDAHQALATLKTGNQRFTEFVTNNQAIVVEHNHQPASEGQAPIAVVVACSDSRLPVEHLFHCGLGQLFVIRVAGNVLTETQIGSVEYACSVLGAKLVVILGHSHCGAVNAAVDCALSGQAMASPNLAEIVEQITPAVDQAIQQHGSEHPIQIAQTAIELNVHNVCHRLIEKSEVLQSIPELNVVGASYDIDSGKVSFLD